MVRKIQSPFQLPFIVWFVGISTIIACSFGGIRIYGFNLKGYAWILTLMISSFILIRIIRALHNVSFPWFLWLPWILLLIIYFLFFEFENALQRTFMMLCPIVVGTAISVFPIREGGIKHFSKFWEYITIAFYVLILINTGILAKGVLPEATGLAPQAMTGALLATLFVVKYVYGNKKALFYWIGLAIIPVIALTRMGIIATLLSYPMSFAPLKMIKRLTVFVIIGVIGVSLFYTERVQKKMFYSGGGQISDVRLDNPDLFTTGRIMLWEIMEEEIRLKPWWGYGANANESFIVRILGFQGQPHNDWMRLRFDYGYMGTFIFGLCMLFQVLHAWKMARKTNGETRILFYAGASSFLPFVLFMLTDNIILYCQFFGNLQFAILGLAYASLKTSEKDAAWLRYQTYFSSSANPNLPHNQVLRNSYPVRRSSR